jgi:hypothetical protein
MQQKTLSEIISSLLILWFCNHIAVRVLGSATTAHRFSIVRGRQFDVGGQGYTPEGIKIPRLARYPGRKDNSRDTEVLSVENTQA